MKYYVPKQGPYESGLTAKLMCSIVDGLIKKHVTNEYVERLRNARGFGLDKLWTKPAIRSELEEFVRSYSFTDLKVPLPGFDDVFSGGSVGKNLESYMAKLEKGYGSRDEAKRHITPPLEELKKRGDMLYREIVKISHLKKGKSLIKNNAHDAFAHLSVIYARVQLAASALGI